MKTEKKHRNVLFQNRFEFLTSRDLAEEPKEVGEDNLEEKYNDITFATSSVVCAREKNRELRSIWLDRFLYGEGKRSCFHLVARKSHSERILMLQQ